MKKWLICMDCIIEANNLKMVKDFIKSEYGTNYFKNEVNVMGPFDADGDEFLQPDVVLPFDLSNNIIP